MSTCRGLLIQHITENYSGSETAVNIFSSHKAYTYKLMKGCIILSVVKKSANKDPDGLPNKPDCVYSSTNLQKLAYKLLVTFWVILLTDCRQKQCHECHSG